MTPPNLFEFRWLGWLATTNRSIADRTHRVKVCIAQGRFAVQPSDRYPSGIDTICVRMVQWVSASPAQLPHVKKTHSVVPILPVRVAAEEHHPSPHWIKSCTPCACLENVADPPGNCWWSLSQVPVGNPRNSGLIRPEATGLTGITPRPSCESAIIPRGLRDALLPSSSASVSRTRREQSRPESPSTPASAMVNLASRIGAHLTAPAPPTSW